MAKILLNVELESKTFEAQLQKIKAQLDQTFNGTGGAGGGVGGGIKAAKAQVESLQKSFANLLNTLKGSEGKYAPDTFKNLKNEITNALNSTKALNKEMGDGKPTDDQKKRYAQLNKQLSTLSATFATTRVEAQKLQKENKLSIPNVDNLRKKYANLLNTIQGTEKYYKKGTFSSISEQAKQYLGDLNALIPTQKNYAEEVNRLDKELNRLSADFAQTRQSAKNFHGSLGEIVKGFIKFQAAAMIVMKPLQMIRNAWASVNETLVETEDAIVALRRVAGDAANANELYDLAQRYGQTFENVNELATNFARAGYDWNETIKATEAALLALNTAELDATQASEGMIAILQQFGYEASELESIIDKLNITADNAAVSTDALLKALTRTGSSAKNANLTLEETVSIITALSEATGRSGENLGTAINSLIQFSTKASSLDTFAKLGGDVERVVMAYKQGGATVLDIWEELSKVIQQNQNASAESILGENFTTEEFEALNEELREAFGENFAQTTEIYNTASTFRKNYFIALLQNLDQVQESLDTMNESQGYSQRENAQYLDTYTAKVNALKAKWQEMANDEQGLLGIKKELVDMASGLLDIIKKFGGLKNVLESIVAVFTPFLIKWSTVFAVNKLQAIGSALKALFTGAIPAAQKLNAALGIIGVIGSVISLLQSFDYSRQGNIFDIQSKSINNATSSLSDMSTNLEDSTELFKELTEKIVKYRNILDDETIQTRQKEKAQNELLKIQNELVESNFTYANSLDLINGNLETQVGLLNDVSDIDKKRAIISKYLKENEYAIGSAQAYLNTSQKVRFDEYNDAYGTPELAAFLREYGYGVNEYTHEAGDDNWLAWGWNHLSAGFGNKAYQTALTSWYTPQEIMEELVPQLIEDIDNSYHTDERKNYLKSLVYSMADQYGEGSTYNEAYNLVYGNKDAASFAETLSYKDLQAIASGEMSDEEFEALWNNFYKTNEPQGEGSSSNKTNLSDVVNKLEEIRENTEKTKELEEKMLALEEARNQRTVRVYNAETGQWEMRANEKDIQAAQQDLKETALDRITEYLSTDEAQAKLDSGELTLPSWLTDMISQPTSDDAYQAFMLAMGIMSGAVNKTPTSSGATYNNSRSNTTNNNQSYSLNGIPIPAEDAGRYFTPEALDLLNQMGN